MDILLGMRQAGKGMEQRKEILLLLWGQVEKMKEYIVETNGFTKNGRFIVADRVKIIKKGELIRCKDCKYWSWDAAGCKKHNGIICADADDYCSRAERKEE